MKNAWLCAWLAGSLAAGCAPSAAPTTASTTASAVAAPLTHAPQTAATPNSAGSGSGSGSVAGAATGSGAGTSAATAVPGLVPLLSGYEYNPTREALLQAAPQPGTVAALLAVYRDPAQRLDVRTRALVSLRFFDEPAAESALREATTAASTPDAVRRPALKAYATGFADRALPVLQAALSHTDPHTRDAALRMLVARPATDTEAARLAVAHCASEKDEAVLLTCSAKGLNRGGSR